MLCDRVVMCRGELELLIQYFGHAFELAGAQTAELPIKGPNLITWSCTVRHLIITSLDNHTEQSLWVAH